MGARGTRAIDAAARAGVSFSVHEYAHDLRATRHAGGEGYALEAVDALGLDPGRVFKTIVVEVDGRLALAVVPADALVDLRTVAEAIGGRRATLAPVARAEQATGYVAGGISPIATRRSLPTVLDASANDHATIHVSAGRRGLELELAPADLAALTGARVRRIVRRA